MKLSAMALQIASMSLSAMRQALRNIVKPLVLLNNIRKLYAAVLGYDPTSRFFLQLCVIVVLAEIDFNLSTVLVQSTHDIHSNFNSLHSGGLEDRENNSSHNIHAFYNKLYSHSLDVVYYFILSAAKNLASAYFKAVLKDSIAHGIANHAFKSQNIQRIVSKSNSKHAFINIEKHIESATYKASDVYTDLVYVTYTFARALSNAFHNGLGAFFISTAFYSIFTKVGTNFIANKIQIVKRSLSEVQTTIENVIHHSVHNHKVLTQRGGETFVKAQYIGAKELQSKLEWKKARIELIQSTWFSTRGIIDRVFRYYLIGKAVYFDAIKADAVGRAFTISNSIGSFLFWSEVNASNLLEIQDATNHLSTLVTNVVENDQAVAISYKVQSCLSIKHLTISDREGTEIVKVENVAFQKGQRHLIIGKSGSGKSSTLAKIFGIFSDTMRAQGEIIYPLYAANRRPKIIMLGQDDYFPPNASLLEVLYLPSLLPKDEVVLEDIKSRVSALLYESKIDIDGMEGKRGAHCLRVFLENRHDWISTLSGGQKKKIAIISAILQHPDILLLDEVFNGLDEQSVMIMQHMMVKYLPNTMICAIDHHGLQHHKVNPNYNFYHHAYHINQGRFLLCDNYLASSPTPTPRSIGFGEVYTQTNYVLAQTASEEHGLYA